MPDRTRGKLAGGADPLPWLLRGIEGLQRAGCGAIAIPCNTAHGWYDEMQRAAGVPILHIVDAAAAELRRIGVTSGRIGVMGTQATLDMRLYQERLGQPRLGLHRSDPGADGPAGHARDRTGEGQPVAEAYEPLAQVVNALADRGAAAIVLGCTEIPLGIQAGPAEALQAPVVDTIDALARAAIAWARG